MSNDNVTIASRLVNPSEEDTAREELLSAEDFDENVEQPEDQTTADNELEEFELPPKFKGKKLEDVVQSYLNLEKELGRKGQEVGELRKLADQLVERDLGRSGPPPTQAEEEEVDFWDKPEEAVSRQIRKELEPIQKTISETQTERARQRLVTKHPDYEEFIKDPEFQSWVFDSNYRAQMFRNAHEKFDADAAIELIDTYKQLAKAGEVRQQELSQEREETLKKASVETGTGGDKPKKKYYRRADILRLMSEDRDRYLELAPEIRKAYAEGRVR